VHEYWYVRTSDVRVRTSRTFAITVPTKSTMAKRMRSSTSELDSARAFVGGKLPRIDPNDEPSSPDEQAYGLLGDIVAYVKRVLENAQ